MLLIRVSNIWFAGMEKFWVIWKYGIIQKALVVLSIFLVWTFLDPKCMDTSIPNLNKTLDQHKLMPLVSNVATQREWWNEFSQNYSNISPHNQTYHFRSSFEPTVSWISKRSYTTCKNNLYNNTLHTSTVSSLS